MSRDPLDELFGPRDEDAARADASKPGEAGTERTPAHNPFPATETRPTQATAEELFPNAAAFSDNSAVLGAAQSREEPPTMPVPANRKGSGKALPWIVIGAIALLLLIGALIFVNLMTGDDTDQPATPTPTATEEPPTTPSETPSETPTEEPSVESTPTVTEAPDVEVGNTGTMEISYAGIAVDF